MKRSNWSAQVLITLVALAVSPLGTEALAFSKGDLFIPDSEILESDGDTKWYPTTSNPEYASGWPTVDISNQSAVDDLVGGSGVCDAVDGTDGVSDDDDIECIITNAAIENNTKRILALPAGTFHVSSDQTFKPSSGDFVLRGQGASTVMVLEGKGSMHSGSGCVFATKHAKISLQGGGVGATTAWTGGYTAGTRQITVANSAGLGGWVRLRADNDCTAIGDCQAGDCLCVPGVHEDVLSTYAQATVINGTTIELDRDLPFDYSTFTSRTVAPVAMMAPFGIEDIRFDYTGQSVSVDEDRNWVHDEAGICLAYIAHAWIKSIESHDPYAKHVVFERGAARNLLVNSLIQGQTNRKVNASRYCIHFQKDAEGNQIHDNIVDDCQDSFTFQQGADRNLVTYNYSTNWDDKPRSVFFHGEYPSENLVEGNEVEQIIWDDHWGFQGPRNFIVRNRVLGSGSTAMDGVIGQDPDRPGKSGTGSIRLLLNTAYAYGQISGCPTTIDTGNCPGMDFDEETKNLWIERNRWRSTAEPESNQAKAGMILGAQWNGPADITTACGDPATNTMTPGDCPADPGHGSDPVGFNYEAPTAVPGVFSSLTFPRSLVRGWSAAIPAQCNDFSGIGADVDVFSAHDVTLHEAKTAARRRFEQLTCNFACSDGIDNDGDGQTDDSSTNPFGSDPGCAGPLDSSERSAALQCDDGVDNDGDGRSDFDPATWSDVSGGFTAGSGDPGCAAQSSREDPECNDGINNDSEPGIDFDGSPPDNECIDRPWHDSETTGPCGIGFELIFLAIALAWCRRRS